MLMEVGLIAAGIPVGWLLRKHEKAQQVVAASLTWTVRIMLFLLGFALGGNAELLAQISSLGLRALVISLLAVAGSMFLGRLISRSLNMDLLGSKSDQP